MEIQAKVRAQAAVPAKPASKVDGKDVAAVAAQPAKPEASAKANFNMPADLAGMSKLWGEQVVYAAAKNAIVISVQATMRRAIDAGKSAAEIQKVVDEFKPDVRNVVKQSAFEKATGAIKSLSAEERAKLLKELQAAK